MALTALTGAGEAELKGAGEPSTAFCSADVMLVATSNPLFALTQCGHHKRSDFNVASAHCRGATLNVMVLTVRVLRRHQS